MAAYAVAQELELGRQMLTSIRARVQREDDGSSRDGSLIVSLFSVSNRACARISREQGVFFPVARYVAERFQLLDASLKMQHDLALIGAPHSDLLSALVRARTHSLSVSVAHGSLGRSARQ